MNKDTLISILFLVALGGVGYLLFHPEIFVTPQDISGQVEEEVSPQENDKPVSDISVPEQQSMDAGVGEDDNSKGQMTAPEFQYAIDTKDLLLQGLAVSDGKIYVSYAGVNRVDILSSKGEPLDFFIPFPNGAVDITSLTVDQEGNIYVVDKKNNLILVFKQDKSFLYTFPPVSEPSARQAIGRPSGISINDRSVLITDQESRAAKVFLNNGEFVIQVQVPSPPDNATWLPGTVVQTDDGRMVVADLASNKVAVFSCDGRLAYYFEQPEKPHTLGRPGGMVIDSTGSMNRGRIHLMDEADREVLVYDNFGRYLFSYGRDLHKSNSDAPARIAIDPQAGLLFLTSPSSRQIEVWKY